jgi:D-alanyl-D-alanine carboxypeptidase
VPWWSLTKTAIAMAALQLAEAGRPDLDAGAPSLRALLRHEARLPDYGALPAYAEAVARGDTAWPVAELLARVAALPAPGAWAYSNVGYLVARQAVEAAADAPLGAALRDLVLGPLGLDATRLAVRRGDMDRLALPSPDYDPAWVYHGCLVGPVAEAAGLVAALRDGRLLAPASTAAMRDAVAVGGPLPGRPWIEARYGLGLMTGRMQGQGGPVDVFGHSAGGPGSTGAVYAFPGLADAPVVAAFGAGAAGDACEWAAVARAGG